MRIRISPVAIPVLSPSRKLILLTLHELALRELGSDLRWSEVTVSSTPGEEDSYYLLLTMFATIPFLELPKMQQCIIEGLVKESEGWGPSLVADYSRRIYFDIESIPG